MSCLVTGAAGCLGTSLCLALLERGVSVIGVDNFLIRSRNNAEILSKNQEFQFVEMSVEDPQFIEKMEAFSFDEIYHLAFPTGVANLTRLAEEMIEAASMGSKNILEIAKRKQAKVLMTSSSEVYGDPKEFPQKETYTGNVDPVGPRSAYEEGKRFAEMEFIQLGKKYAADVRIARVFNTFGPYFTENTHHVIPTFITLARKNEALPVHGKGDQNRTFLYVDDFVEGVMTIMEKGETLQIYNLGSDTQTAIIDLAKLILQLTDSKGRIEYIERPKHDHQGRLPALDKIHQLGWKQKISLEAGLKKILSSI